MFRRVASRPRSAGSWPGSFPTCLERARSRKLPRGMRTLAWDTVGSTVLGVHSRQLPVDPEWQEFIAHCMKAPHGQQALIFADINLNAKQRRDVQRLHETMGIRRVA